MTEFDGLCLDCVRDPGRDDADWESCGVPHQDHRGIQRQGIVSARQWSVTGGSEM